MNDKIIETVLTELLEEVKEIKIEHALNTKAVELYSESINNFEELLKTIKLNCPPPDLKPIENLINKRMTDIEKTIAAQPKEVINEKRILFYPEGDGRNFLKFLADKAMLYIVIAGFLYGLSWLGLHYWKMNTENERMKLTLYWYFDTLSDKEKVKVAKIANEFKNDSIYNARRKLFK